MSLPNAATMSDGYDDGFTMGSQLAGVNFMFELEGDAPHLSTLASPKSFAVELPGDTPAQIFQLSSDNDDLLNTMANGGVKVPRHPISSMQGAFAESMREASNPTPRPPKPVGSTAASRRQVLLEEEPDATTHAARWQLRSGEQYHELWKLMAQVSFGIYLLLNGIARDDEQVMSILQVHVDEVDEFLEDTLEDFDLALEDIDERLKFLKLPLENIEIFDAMLEDRQFRAQIVDGNEKIEHVITRTAAAMKDALLDVQEGLNACKEFTIYLAEGQEDPTWRKTRPDMVKVFDAMKGNVEGWYKAYVSLQTKGNQLGISLVQLGSVVAEMDRRAGEISRETRFGNSPRTTPISSPPTSPFRSPQMRRSMTKSLPRGPSMITPAIQSTLPAFQLVNDRERTPSPEAGASSAAASPKPEEQYILLAPTTYTPLPSPTSAKSPTNTSPPRRSPPPPGPTKRSSLRKKFSLKRKDSIPQPQSPVELPQSTFNIEDNDRQLRQRGQSVSAAQPRTSHTTTSSTIATPKERDSTATRDSARGLDSAYCSDFEKPPFSPPTMQYPTLRNDGRTYFAPPSPALNKEIKIPSPLSDTQFFRPVIASPHSPLQRPWTAAPENHHKRNGSDHSGFSMTKSRLHFSSQTTASSLRLRDSAKSGMSDRRLAAPSAMGSSMMSVNGTEGEKKLKKKRSAFGWLKKAFSLSEEEKAAFEAKRQQAYHDNRQYDDRPAPRWVDGRRIR